MTDEEIFKNHTQWMIDNFDGRKNFTKFIKVFYKNKRNVTDYTKLSKEYPYNGYITSIRDEPLLFYLKRFGVNIEETKHAVDEYFIRWNEQFIDKLNIALKIVEVNESLNELNTDFEV